MSLPFFEHLRNEAKTEIKLKIFSKNFKDNQLVSFSKKDLIIAKWNSSDEFILKEKMYDLVKMKKINNEIFYLCLEDSKENNIRKCEEKVASLFQFSDWEMSRNSK